MCIIAVASISLMAVISLQAVAILVAYITLNILYSLYPKHIAILDVTIISIGFILRLFVGSKVTGIQLSRWIVVTTFLLALFLALFVILGIMRYLQIAFVKKDIGSPTRIVLKDKFMQVTILTWVFSFVWIIYL